MRQLFATLTLLSIVTFQLFAQSVEKTDQTPKVALLGTFHFGATSDMGAIQPGDLLTEKRQEELKELVNLLKGYKPTKIMVEFPANKSEKLDSLYISYLSGTYKVEQHEIDLIAFPLSKELGHSKVYSIDHKHNLPFEGLNPYGKEMQPIMKYVSELMQRESEYLATHSMSEMFERLNNTEFDRLANNLYLDAIAKVGMKDSYAGVEIAAEWYKRNLRMMTNIDRLTKDEDRILIIVGQAHRAMLNTFFQSRTDIEYIEISDYLKQNMP